VKIGHKRLLLLLALLVGLMAVSGCAGAAGRQIASGWAGGVVSGNALFVGSMEGKLVALDVSDGSFLGDPVALESQAQSSGGFGCLPTGSSAVAVYGSPVLREDLAYVGGYDGRVRAFLFEEGRLRSAFRWISRQGDILGSIIGGLAVAHDRVYFGASDGRVYALDAVDGSKVWEFKTEDEDKIWSTPAISGGTVFIGGFDRKLYALNADDGTKKWVFETEGTIVCTPVVADGVVYVGSFDRHVYAVDIASGKEVWRYPKTEEEADAPIGWFWASPLMHDGAVYAPNLDGRVYVLDAASGRRIGDYDLGAPISSAPVLVDDTVIVATTSTNRAKKEGEVFAIDTTARRQTMLQDLGESIHAPLFASGDTVYVHTMENNLYAINTVTGVSRKFILTDEASE